MKDVNKWWGIFIHISLQFHSFVFPLFPFSTFIPFFFIFTIQSDWHWISFTTLNAQQEAEDMTLQRARGTSAAVSFSILILECNLFFPWIYDYDKPNKVWTPEIKLPTHFSALHKLYYTVCFMPHMFYNSNETFKLGARMRQCGYHFSGYVPIIII